MKRPKSPSVRLEITQEIIADAVARDSSHCLWAEAVRVAYPEAQRVSVDIQTIRFSDPRKGLRYTYLTPRVAQVSLVQFDQGVLPEPHSVLLRRGQVTRMAQKPSIDAPGKRKLTENELRQRRDAAEKGKKGLAKASVRKTSGAAIDRVGGRTPPIAAGRRRAYGLRGLEY